MYFESKYSSEHLLQQKLKLTVKPLCEVASFLFLRSVRTVHYMFVVVLLCKVSAILQSCTNTKCESLLHVPAGRVCVPDVTRPKLLEQELRDTWGISELPNGFV